MMFSGWNGAQCSAVQFVAILSMVLVTSMKASSTQHVYRFSSVCPVSLKCG